MKMTDRHRSPSGISGLTGTARPPWKALLTGSIAHFIHDGFTDMLYVFFPIWQLKWSLSFAQIGLLKTVTASSLALFQLPAGLIAHRIGNVKLLFIGTAITSIAMMLWGQATGPVTLGMLLVLSGLGSSVQHPVSSSLISDSCADIKTRRAALSAYNFVGDLGKAVLPSLAALLLTFLEWQTAGHLLAFFGLLAAVVLLTLSSGVNLPESTSKAEEKGPGRGGILPGWKGYEAFWTLSMIGAIDNSTRTAFLTFFPFLLLGKGAGLATIGIALTLVFSGGAIGKLACGLLAIRLGVIRSVIATECITAACICGMIILPLNGSLLLAPLLGIALNGTSSVLYGTVPELVKDTQGKHAFPIFYTASLGAGAVSPSIFGSVSDFAGIETTAFIIALWVLITVPLVLKLRVKFAVS